MNGLKIVPVAWPVDARVTVPGSKSITNRALLIAALARGNTELRGALYSDDTTIMAAALRALGVAVEEDPAGASFQVAGAGGAFPARGARLHVGASGTAARFLTAALPLGKGEFLLDGVPRMRERPIAPLLTALRQLGADAASVAGNGCPPVRVRAAGLLGGRCSVRGDVSSQYLSALLMVGPCSQRGVVVDLEGPLVSGPFVELTAAVMRGFGAEVQREPGGYRVPPGQYTGRAYRIEPDATAASYFFAAAAVTGGRITVTGLGRNSLQGDVAFLDVLERMGCATERLDDAVTVWGPPTLGGCDVDMGDISDTALTLAAIAPFASAPVRMRNLGHTRRQESDRLAAVTTELRRLGGHVDEGDTSLTIHPAPLHGGEIETYGDHRMAMSFSLIGLKVDGLTILDPECVAKTFPDYFERFGNLTNVIAGPRA